jgi:hypothetical protein
MIYLGSPMALILVNVLSAVCLCRFIQINIFWQHVAANLSATAAIMPT